MAHEYDAENARSEAELGALLTTLTPPEFDIPLGEGWTVRSAIGHLAFWDARVAAVCMIWQQGRPTPPSPPEDPLDEATNAALDPLIALLPAQAVVRLAVDAAQRANAALAALSPRQAAVALAEDSPIVAHRSRHRREHIAQISAALGHDTRPT